MEAPPTLNKIQLKAENSELGVSLRLKSPEQYELLMREGAVPAITDTKWQMSMPINDKSS